MRISDWSSDVCSSDLARGHRPWSLRCPIRYRRRPPSISSCHRRRESEATPRHHRRRREANDASGSPPAADRERSDPDREDRKSVVEGKSVSVRVDLGGRRIIKKKTNKRKKER